ncbi:MAG: L-serine ammonia-lyase, iron-sulfur-dependent, subunit alpha [Defluviitaleaceae bacterium]|nr:L-serine ammonia-lyase, iron-sulfur-dependent, subunit alpha [Defluviitaleaceae bacterium]
MKNLKYKSIFDIIGPKMIGPSSSHTAGVVRIGNKARELFDSKTANPPTQADIYLYGSFEKTYKGHATDVACVGGILGFEPHNPKISNAFHYAQQEKININILPTSLKIPIDIMENLGENNPHPNTIKIVLKNDYFVLEVIGISIGGGNIKIISPYLEVDEFSKEYAVITSIENLLYLSEKTNKTIAEITIENEAINTGYTKAQIINTMKENYNIMELAIQKGIEGVNSISGKTGYGGKILYDYLKIGNFITSETFVKALCYAISTNEVNAAMGVICATPTAGSAGVIPAVLFSIKDKLKMTKDDCINFLFNSAAFGLCIANNAYISGASGGCQAEIGSASAMAAASTVIASGGTNNQAANAFSFAIKNMLGLICDPVAGLVEIPCITRNAAGATNALCAAEMAIAGMKTRIPADEVILAMKNVGDRMHKDFKETGRGGLATTKTGMQIEKYVFGSNGPNSLK